MELTLIELHDFAGGGPAMLAAHAVEFVQPIYETRPGSREPVLHDGKPRAAGSRIMLTSGVIVEVAETPYEVAERMAAIRDLFIADQEDQ